MENDMKTKNIKILFDYLRRLIKKKRKQKKTENEKKNTNKKVGASMERQKVEWGKEL